MFELLNYCLQIWVYGFAEWMTFVVTLAMYPAVTVLVNSTGRGNSNPWNGENHYSCMYSRKCQL